MGIELMLKAWLLHRVGSFKGIHKLKELINALAEVGEVFEFSEYHLQIINYVSNFSELRYPSLKSPVEIGDSDLELVREVVGEIWNQIPDDLVDAYKSIPFHKKGSRVIMRRKKGLPRNLELETGITAKP